MMSLIIPGSNGMMVPPGLAKNVAEQVHMIMADFRNSYFSLAGSVINSWYNSYPGYEQFVSSSFDQQRAIYRAQQDMQQALIHGIAGEVEGIGDILALRLGQNYGINPMKIHDDIGYAVDNILYGGYSGLMTGVRKLGYWSGFSRAITY